LSQGESENGLSRIYGGIHFPFDNVQGQALGVKVAAYVLLHGPHPRDHFEGGKDGRFWQEPEPFGDDRSVLK